VAERGPIELEQEPAEEAEASTESEEEGG